MTSNEYDYVIAGGGTAGCVLANRLSSDPGVTVLLVEAGPPDHNPFIHVPAGSGRLKAYEWGLWTVAQRQCEGQRFPFPVGKVVGGGGSINAQVFTRGASSDYDSWSNDYGCAGWSFEEVLPYFIRSEVNSRLSLPFHGQDGPLSVSDQVSPHPLSLAFVKAGQEYGLPYNSDFNGASQYGVGLYQSTTRAGFRCSAATAYLRPARWRPNLTVMTRRSVTRVLFEGTRATQVEVMEGSRRTTVRARREIVLAAGAVGSPRILQLSGVGDPAHLKAAGIAVHNRLPGVGHNFQDHYGIEIVYELRKKLSLDRFNQPRPSTVAAGLEYAFFRTGPLASTVVEAGAFNYATDDKTRPDIQFCFLPAANDIGVPRGYGVKLDAYFLRPRSRGSVMVASADPGQMPLVDPNYLAENYDLEMSVAIPQQIREIMGQPSMARHTRAEHIPDGVKLVTRDDYVTFVRQHGRSSYHPVGTCAMGDGDDAVVSPELKVYGLEGLRVVDGSVMPTLVSSNTQAPIVMIAEKASDLILSAR
jgi:choline dehydrogenase